MTIELWHCPPLSCRIREEVCKANAAKARAALKTPARSPERMDAFRQLGACTPPGQSPCPGVRELARRGESDGSSEFATSSAPKPREAPVAQRRPISPAPNQPRAAAARKRGDGPDLSKLSPRERQVYELRSNPDRPLSNTEAAKRLGISAGAASVYFSTALRKLGLSPGRPGLRKPDPTRARVHHNPPPATSPPTNGVAPAAPRTIENLPEFLRAIRAERAQLEEQITAATARLDALKVAEEAIVKAAETLGVTL